MDKKWNLKRRPEKQQQCYFQIVNSKKENKNTSQGHLSTLNLPHLEVVYKSNTPSATPVH